MYVADCQTLEDRFVACDRRPSGFDYLRLSLAILVVFSHTATVSYGMGYTIELFNGPARVLNGLILPMFFALSGFLVAGSLERCRTIVSFLGLRFIRLIPALAVETVLAALVIGTIFTKLNMFEYFSDPLFVRYGLNIVGHVQFVLPGVFLDNPIPSTVNGQLWTLPYELKCYALISIIVLIGAASHRLLFLSVVVILNIALVLYKISLGSMQIVPIVPGVILVLCFLYGISFYLYRGVIVWSGKIFFACAILALVFLLPNLRPFGDYAVPVFATYMTVYIGLLQPKRVKALLTGDYSYGIFLYGYPVQQAVIAAMGESGHHWYMNFIVSMPIIFVVAALSWWFVEKPSLRLRKRLIGFEDKILDFCTKYFPKNFPIYLNVHPLEPLSAIDEK